MSLKTLVLASLVVLTVLLLPHRLVIQKIECSSQFGKCSEIVKNDLEKLLNKNFTLKSSNSKVEDLLSKNPRILDFSTQYVPANSLKVHVVERKGEVAIKELGSDTYLIVDNLGQLIEERIESELPKIQIESGSLKVGSDEINFSSSLVSELAKYYNIRQTKIDGFSMRAKYDSLELIFPLEGNIDVLLGSLELLLFQLNRSLQASTIDKVSVTNLSSIDLRYKNPIVK